MKTTTILKVAALAAAALAAGAALAAPDAAAAILAALTSPEALAGTLLAWGPLVRKLEGERAAAIDSMTAIVQAAEAQGRGMNDEEKARYDAEKAKAASLKDRITVAQENELLAAGVSRDAAGAAAQRTSEPNDGRAVTLPAAAVLQVKENIDDDEKRGFAHVGDFARSVYGIHVAQRTGGSMDRRLQPLLPRGVNAAAPSTFAGEGVGADGGVLVPPAFARSIFNLSLEEQALLPMTDVMPVEGNGMTIPRDETTPWGTNGVRAYWQGEATAGTPTKPVFGGMELKLKKLMALVPVSDELLADASALSAYLPPLMARSIRWKTDEAVLFGTGAGTPLGAFSGAAGIVVPKKSGQSTLTLVPENCASMMARLPAGSYSRAVWLINNDVLPALFTMTLGNYPIYLPAGAPVGGIVGSPYGSLLGRPIVVTQHAKSFSSQGDVMLVDMSYYQSITKAEGIAMATSMHLYFDADAMALRATFRVDGQPKLSAPISPANGSTTLSPFLQLEAR